MKFLEETADAYASGSFWLGKNVRRLLANYCLWIVPMVNPDGVELVLNGITPNHPYGASLLAMNHGSGDFSNWKANIRGVDLNDQFPAHWEVECERRGQLVPGERDYGGDAPLTEPEASAMAEFTRESDFELVLALHTQGQEIYWNYRDYEPSCAEIMANRLAKASGYQAVKLTGSDAGYKDWFIQEFRRPGFTIEVGCGVNPLPAETFDLLYEEIKPLLLEGMQLLEET